MTGTFKNISVLAEILCGYQYTQQEIEVLCKALQNLETKIQTVSDNNDLITNDIQRNAKIRQ